MKRLGLTGIAALAAMAALVAPGSGGAAAGDQIDSSKVHARFGLGRPADGPFPADWYTVEDASNLTGVRVSLPLPDCSIDRSECEDIGVLNELDGFNPQPRVSVPFDGAIDLATTTSDSVFLLDIDRGRRVRIDQLVWDPATTTLHFESDELLRQHSSYAVIVTRAVHDSEGSAIKTTPAFREFLEAPCADERECDYQQAVREALAAAERLGTPAGSVASASVFTTLSSTAVMEKIRDQIKATTPEPIDFRLGAGGGRTAFAIAEVWFDRQTRVDGPLSPVRLDLAPLGVVPGAVGQIAYGRFASADYQAGPGVLPVIGTRTGTPAVQRVNKLSCTLVLPSGFGFGEQSSCASDLQTAAK